MNKVPAQTAIPIGALALSGPGGSAASPTPGFSCEATSGPGTGALFERFTSEGCSSCPPADRRWMGPFSLDKGKVALRRSVPIARDWHREPLEASAVVQDQSTGRVLQALGIGRCAAIGGPET